MSWQSGLFNFVAGFAIKRRTEDKSYAEAREVFSRLMDQPPKVPKAADHTREHLNGVACDWVWAKSAADSRHVVMYFHGGAFMCGSPNTHFDLAWRLSDASGMKVLLVDYRLTPEHVFPAPLDDAVNVYRALLERGYRADQIAFGGDSAGGNMTLSVMVKLQALDLPLPFAGLCFSPWADLTHSGESIERNAGSDTTLSPSVVINAAEVYAAGEDQSRPLLSPVFADYTGMPPLLVYVGTDEVLLDDARAIQRAATAQGVEVEYEEWHKQPHAFPVMGAFMPEARKALQQAGDFLRRKAGPSHA